MPTFPLACPDTNVHKRNTPNHASDKSNKSYEASILVLHVTLTELHCTSYIIAILEHRLHNDKHERKSLGKALKSQLYLSTQKCLVITLGGGVLIVSTTRNVPVLNTPVVPTALQCQDQCFCQFLIFVDILCSRMWTNAYIPETQP